jgi:hypothetical protein
MTDPTPLIRMLAQQLVDEFLAEVADQHVAAVLEQAQNPAQETADEASE